MLPDRVSNPGPQTYESSGLPIALRGPAVFRDNFSLIIDRFTSILPQVTGNGRNIIQNHPSST